MATKYIYNDLAFSSGNNLTSIKNLSYQNQFIAIDNHKIYRQHEATPSIPFDLGNTSAKNSAALL
jgi:hypothetical protein